MPFPRHCPFFNKTFMMSTYEMVSHNSKCISNPKCLENANAIGKIFLTRKIQSEKTKIVKPKKDKA